LNATANIEKDPQPLLNATTNILADALYYRGLVRIQIANNSLLSQDVSTTTEQKQRIRIANEYTLTNQVHSRKHKMHNEGIIHWFQSALEDFERSLALPDQHPSNYAQLKVQIEKCNGFSFFTLIYYLLFDVLFFLLVHCLSI